MPVLLAVNDIIQRVKERLGVTAAATPPLDDINDILASINNNYRKVFTRTANRPRLIYNDTMFGANVHSTQNVPYMDSIGHAGIIKIVHLYFSHGVAPVSFKWPDPLVFTELEPLSVDNIKSLIAGQTFPSGPPQYYAIEVHDTYAANVATGGPQTANLTTEALSGAFRTWLLPAPDDATYRLFAEAYVRPNPLDKVTNIYPDLSELEAEDMLLLVCRELAPIVDRPELMDQFAAEMNDVTLLAQQQEQWQENERTKIQAEQPVQ